MHFHLSKFFINFLTSLLQLLRILHRLWNPFFNHDRFAFSLFRALAAVFGLRIRLILGAAAIIWLSAAKRIWASSLYFEFFSFFIFLFGNCRIDFVCGCGAWFRWNFIFFGDALVEVEQVFGFFEFSHVFGVFHTRPNFERITAQLKGRLVFHSVCCAFVAVWSGGLLFCRWLLYFNHFSLFSLNF